MATKHHNPEQIIADLPDASGLKFGIVVAEWNSEITNALAAGAVRALKSAGCTDEDIVIKYVPGTFELPLAAQYFAQYSDVDAVVVLGCVIQGDTRHFDYVCSGVTQGVMKVQLEWNIPVAFGVLTVDNQQQAIDRAGGALGNKGEEAAATALKMVSMQYKMEDDFLEADLAAQASSTLN